MHNIPFVIVHPGLQINECGISYEVALKIFEDELFTEILKNNWSETKEDSVNFLSILTEENQLFVSSFISKKPIIVTTFHSDGSIFDTRVFHCKFVAKYPHHIHFHPLICSKLPKEEFTITAQVSK